MLDFVQAKQIAAVLAAVGEPTRILILHHLAVGPAHVGQLAEAVGVPMVNMSHHLGVMRTAGLLADLKEGRRVIYSLRPDVFTPGGPDALGELVVGTYRLALVGPPPPRPAADPSADGRRPAAKKSAGKKPVAKKATAGKPAAGRKKPPAG